MIKKCICLILFLVINVLPLAAQSVGDVNNSGNVDILDALMIAQYTVGLNPAGFNANTADVDCNGSIIIVDALLVVQYFVGLLTSLPGCIQTPTPVSSGLFIDDYVPSINEYLYQDYINNLDYKVETGGSGGTRIITNPILVRQGTTYDGKGEKLIAEGLGDGSQDEDQKPYFLLEPGAILKNVTIAAPGTEGVHCMGNNIVDNVHWEDIGEDALSVRSYFPGGDITIMNGSAYYGAGTCFQFNTAVTVRISNFTASNLVDFLRQDYKFPFDMTVYLDNCTINNFENAIVKSEFPTCYVYYRNLKTNEPPSKWWKILTTPQIF